MTPTDPTTPPPERTPPDVWGLWSYEDDCWLGRDGWRCTFASERNAVGYCKAHGLTARPVRLVPAGSEVAADKPAPGAIRVETMDKKLAIALVDWLAKYPKVEDGSTVITVS